MTVYVYQTFEIRQEKFTEAFANLEKIVNYRNDHYSHKVELLSPIAGRDYSYVLLSKYEGLAEMELQNRKMFDDDEFKEIFTPFFLENIVQGSMTTAMYRTVKRNAGKPVAQEEEEDEKEE
ncbi:hypothetical protein [Bacillus sp. FJAT-27445]|uniref:hypothetical protein n=1 Tax=Bacillus sp. FJAT-27445 TaxID=1679166 RepID=UPI0007437538|nr:hypothetical protein [Bacillus sp. FJAT-27445]